MRHALLAIAILGGLIIGAGRAPAPEQGMRYVMRFTGEQVEVEGVGMASDLLRRYEADARPLFYGVAEADSAARAIALRHPVSASVEVTTLEAFRERYWRADR